MIGIRVTYAKGDTVDTSINATIDEARAYYVGQVFNVGLGPHDNLQEAIAVEALEMDICPECGGTGRSAETTGEFGILAAYECICVSCLGTGEVEVDYSELH